MFKLGRLPRTAGNRGVCIMMEMFGQSVWVCVCVRAAIDLVGDACQIGVRGEKTAWRIGECSERELSGDGGKDLQSWIVCSRLRIQDMTQRNVRGVALGRWAAMSL